MFPPCLVLTCGSLSTPPAGRGKEENASRNQGRVRAAAEREGGEEAAAANQPQGEPGAGPRGTGAGPLPTGGYKKRYRAKVTHVGGRKTQSCGSPRSQGDFPGRSTGHPLIILPEPLTRGEQLEDSVGEASPPRTRRGCWDRSATSSSRCGSGRGFSLTCASPR